MFTQSASGEFSIEVSGLYHCGPNHDSPKMFHYDVQLSWPDDALDDKGFLLDNTAFQAYFDHLGHTDLSCERLVIKAHNDIQAMCDAHYPGATVVVSLIPFGHVKVTYTR